MAATLFCNHCKKTDVHLKVCGKCKTARYCGPDCQKEDWTSHRLKCTAPAQTSTGPRIETILPGDPNDPTIVFTRIQQKTYLHDRPEKDVYKLLIDAFRLHESDGYDYRGDLFEDSLLGGAPNSVKPFRRYLKQAAKKNILPPWWNEAKQRECIEFGLKDSFSNLSLATEKPDIIEHYSNSFLPMQLRMLTETIRGRSTME